MFLFRRREIISSCFSPEGLPFLYPLHPQTWPTGEHHVTLRLPPVRRTQTGRLTYPDGKPAANFPVRVSRAYTGMEYWQISTEETTGAIFTDAEGGYALPQYFGMDYQYEARQESSYAFDMTTGHAVLENNPAEPIQKPSEYKQITLHFVDEQCDPRSEIRVGGDELYQGKTLTESTSGDPGVADANGYHVFVKTSTDRLVFTTQADAWNPLTKPLALPGAGDQAFTILMPQSLHRKRLTGVILAPNGTPVSRRLPGLVRRQSAPPVPSTTTPWDFSLQQTRRDVLPSPPRRTRAKLTYIVLPKAGRTCRAGPTRR